MPNDPDVLVLRKDVHGIAMDEFAQILRSRLPECTVAHARTPADERDLIETARFAVGLEFDRSLLEQAETLELFASVFAGVGHLPLEAFREAGVTVVSASGVHGPNVAEHVLGAILTFTRNFQVGFRRQTAREWRHYPAHELQGSTVTVVGLGPIGEAVLERLEPFGVETIGIRYSPEKGGPADEVYGYDRLHDALARTEYLVLACPLTEETRGVIDRDAFATLPTAAVLVNVARGPVVDTDALVEALQIGWIRGAALDVTDPEPLPESHPLWNFGNVQITPHNAGHTPKYYDRLADIVAGAIEDVRSGVPPSELENAV